MFVANTKNPDLRYNNSGYADMTAYEALQNVRREERRQLIAELKEVAKKHGYKITSTIELKELEGCNSDT